MVDSRYASTRSIFPFSAAAFRSSTSLNEDDPNSKFLSTRGVERGVLEVCVLKVAFDLVMGEGIEASVIISFFRDLLDFFFFFFEWKQQQKYLLKNYETFKVRQCKGQT